VHAKTADPIGGAAVLLPAIASLEVAGWSLRRMAEAEHSARAAGAIAEAVAASKPAGSTGPNPASLIAPWSIGLGARLAPIAMPFDIETYLRVHFTKVGPQTRLILDDLRARAARRGLGHQRLDELASRLAELHPGA
jgi:2-dehydropantoate 2-reductase